MTYQKNPKYDHAVEMYERGLSIVDIARFYGIGRQSMWKILKLRNYRPRPGAAAGQESNFARGGAKADKQAHTIVQQAIIKGILTPMPCEVCGAFPIAKDGRRLIHAHHDDYSKPLHVRWLCQRHHHEHHKRLERPKGDEQ